MKTARRNRAAARTKSRRIIKRRENWIWRADGTEEARTLTPSERDVEASLLTCPFCGEAPKMQPWHGGSTRKVLIGCDNFNCPVQPSVTGETARQAKANWDQRA